MGEAIESFELVPKSALDLVLTHVPGTRPPLAESAAWNVLIEAVSPMSTPSPEPLLYEGLRSALETGIANDAVIAASEAQAEDFWRLRDSISEAEKKDGPATKHDISVAVEDAMALCDAWRASSTTISAARINDATSTTPITLNCLTMGSLPITGTP